MDIKMLTLLSENDYEEYKFIIPNIQWHWWLTTSCFGQYGTCIRVVDHKGELEDDYHFDSCIGVRPLCVFSFEPVDTLFWHKADTLVGTKVRIGKYSWTVLDVKKNVLYALCDDIITRRRFDSDCAEWDDSELKKWLDAEGIKTITT